MGGKLPAQDLDRIAWGHGHPALHNEGLAPARLAPARAARPPADVLAAFIAAGGSVADAETIVGVRPSTAKRSLTDPPARSWLTTEQLFYRGRAEGWLAVASLQPPSSLERH